MRIWIRRITGLLTVGVLLLVIGTLVAEQIEKRRVDREVEELLGDARPVGEAAILQEDLAELPEPVQRWLTWSGVIGRTPVSTLRLKQEGDFRLKPSQDWMPFDATQYYTVDPPGFHWEVSMQMFPLVDVVGRDRYQDGTGSIEMKVLSLIPVASSDGGDLDQGAALRYLNEIMWFPTAALSQWIEWTPIDDTSAMATLTYAGMSVTATFQFDDEGRIVTMTADRFNDEKGVVLPWSTPIDGYGEFDGMRIPVKGRGVWDYPEGPFEYVRLMVTSVEYDPK